MSTFVLWQTCNIFLAIVVSYLGWMWYVREAVSIVAVWVTCDILAVVVFMTEKPHLRDSILLHHLITLGICTVHLTVPACCGDDNARHLLLMELSTPVVCLHDIVNNRVTRVLKSVTWLLVRTWTSFHVLSFLVMEPNECIQRMGAYVLMLLTLTVSWTIKCDPRCARFQLLLAAYYVPSSSVSVLSLALMTAANAAQERMCVLALVMHVHHGISTITSVVLAGLMEGLLDTEMSQTATILSTVHAIVQKEDVDSLCAACVMFACLVRHRCGPGRMPFASKIAWYGCVGVLIMRGE